METKKVISSYIIPSLEKTIRLSDLKPDGFILVETRKSLKKAIQKKRILINGLQANTADHISGGEELSLLDDGQDQTVFHPLPNLEVIFEDDYLAIINKPAGIPVHGHKAHTIQNCLYNSLKQSSIPDALKVPLAVHRLDYPTSGALLIAKTKTACLKLHQSFQNRAIEKKYLAVLVGHIQSKQLSCKQRIDNKEASTSMKILDQIESAKYKQLSLFEVNPSTGRRHQIRKHCLALGHPILGDQLYYLTNLSCKLVRLDSHDRPKVAN